MDAETSRLLAGLLRSQRIAHLATLRERAPMASMTLFLAAEDFGGFFVHVSRLAWHTQDMERDAHVALSVAETDDARADPFRLMRVTVRGAATRVGEDASLEARWLARFPAQAINFELPDFSFWRIAPRDARFVAGFGRIHNLSPQQLTQAART